MHREVAKMSEKYGPVVSVAIGKSPSFCFCLICHRKLSFYMFDTQVIVHKPFLFHTIFHHMFDVSVFDVLILRVSKRELM